MNQPAARAPDKAPDFRPGKSTFMLVPKDIHESMISRAYIKEKYGESEATAGSTRDGARIVEALPFHRLDENSHVVVVARWHAESGAQNSGIVSRVKLSAGEVELRDTPASQLVSEVKEGKPIHCADFWTENPNELDGGSLDQSRFCTAVMQSTRSWAMGRNPEDELKHLWLKHV